MQPLDHSQYVSLTMEFRCNLKCVHCMIEDTMDRFKPESMNALEELFTFNRQSKRWKGLILTGSEITLNNNLEDWARRARQAGFERIRIQTHGMKLAKINYLDRLIEAGVNEFFVSVAGSDAQSHDDITLVPSSFEKTFTGLKNLDHYKNVISLTNTVVTQNSYQLLPDIVHKLRDLRNLRQMEFWIYWPMSEADDKNLIAPYGKIKDYLINAIELAAKYNREIEVKNFPQCLLGKYQDKLVNAQPQLYIDPDFWNEFARNGFYQCPHQQNCATKDCLGLSTAYIKKFDDERQLLQPLKEPEPLTEM